MHIRYATEPQDEANYRKLNPAQLYKTKTQLGEAKKIIQQVDPFLHAIDS